MIESRKLFTEALESGEFKKCKGKLSEGREKFCLWGAACELYTRLHPGEIKCDIVEGTKKLVAYNGFAAAPPAKVREWLQLPYEDEEIELKKGVVYKGKVYRNMYDLNDETNIRMKAAGKLLREYWEDNPDEW